MVAAASLLAGCIDALMGGGGLILLPALLGTYPQVAPATLFGTNKGGAVWGTALAAWRYARQVPLRWASLLPAVGAAWLGSAWGAWAVTQVDPSGLRRALPVLLVGVLVYTLVRKDLGRVHQPRWTGGLEAAVAGALGLCIGFYDGFFGPGTGSFFVFAWVRLMGHDFLSASAHAKVLNTATNVSALTLFSLSGHVWWQVAAVLAVANMAGSLLGTHLALRHGSGLVRQVFIVVVGLLILKTGYDAYALM